MNSTATPRPALPTASAADEPLDRLCRLAATVLGATLAGITLVDPERGVLLRSIALPGRREGADELALAERFWHRVAERGEPLNIADVRHDGPSGDAAPDGPACVMAYLGVPLRLSDGPVAGVLAVGETHPRAWTDRELAVLRDLAASVVTELEWRALTERRERVEAALRDSEERYRLMIEGSEQVFFYVHDDQHRFRYLSPSIERVLGYTPEQLLGRPYDVLLTGDASDEQVHASTHQGLDDGSGTSVYPARTRHSDGRVVTLELVESPVLHEGRVVAMQGFARDISERVHVEEAMRQTNRTLRALIDALPLAVVTLDANSVVRGWNPAAERIFGWAEAEVLGRPYPLITPEQYGEHRAMLDRALDGQTFAGREVQRHARDGSPIDLAFWSAPLHDSAGRIESIIGVYVDITERKQLEEQLRQAQKMEAIGRLAGGIAHDFNNLLTAVKGNAEMLLLERPEGELAAGLEEIRQAAIRAAGLTRQLLAFSRKQVLLPEVMDLNGVILEMQTMLRRLIGEHIEFVAALDTELGRIKADPGQIEQVILNLAVNARDAMPGGGALVVETRNVQLPAAGMPQPEGLAPGPYVMLAVSDTGHGMDGDTQARVFEPFFTTKGLGQGTGLGLSTVYGIVKQSGGGISLESAAQAGATFRIFLPRVEPAVPAKPATPAEPTHAHHNGNGKPHVNGNGHARENGNGNGKGNGNGHGHCTVLLVEDEPAVRTLAQRILERHGYTVLSAGEAESALRLQESSDEPISLLLTDVVMPGLSGPALAARLADRSPRTRVLYMSGYAGDTILQHGVSENGHAFIEKPFTAEGLLHKVGAVLAGD